MTGMLMIHMMHDLVHPYATNFVAFALPPDELLQLLLNLERSTS